MPIKEVEIAVWAGVDCLYLKSSVGGDILSIPLAKSKDVIQRMSKVRVRAVLEKRGEEPEVAARISEWAESPDSDATPVETRVGKRLEGAPLPGQLAFPLTCPGCGYSPRERYESYSCACGDYQWCAGGGWVRVHSGMVAKQADLINQRYSGVAFRRGKR